MQDRYERNREAITPGEQQLLAEKHVLVVGCGGLGGYIIETLGRLGVGYITVVDGDVFQPSNLNRQLLSSMENLGRSKAEAAAERMAAINPEVQVIPVSEYLTAENAAALLRGQDAVVDALDRAQARLLLAEHAARAGIPVVHGAIAGWCARIAVIFPGDPTLNLLYGGEPGQGLERVTGNLSFTAACTASFQAAETLKLLLGRGRVRRGATLELDLLTGAVEWLDWPGDLSASGA